MLVVRGRFCRNFYSNSMGIKFATLFLSFWYDPYFVSFTFTTSAKTKENPKTSPSSKTHSSTKSTDIQIWTITNFFTWIYPTTANPNLCFLRKTAHVPIFYSTETFLSQSDSSSIESTGSLWDWFDNLGQCRQLQFIQIPYVSQALAQPSTTFEAARRDYLNMKCCSRFSSRLVW